MKNTYKDRSIFSGVAEYDDEEGNTWRRMNEGFVWAFYKLEGDCFIRHTTIKKPEGKCKKTVREIHNLMMQLSA